MAPHFAPFDWLVIGLYVALLLGGGWAFSRFSSRDTHDYFLAGRTVPAWLAAVSVLSATQSAATFLGAPDYGYRLDYTYLGATFSMLLAAAFVAHVLIPRFYAMRATTVYELLAHRFDTRAMRWAGGMFLFGRVLAGGARVYLAAIAIAMVMFSSIDAASIVLAAFAVMAVSFLFTFHGGLRSVIWNDLLQFAVYVGSAIAVIVFLRLSIPATNGEIVAALSAAPPEGVNKLRLLDWSVDLSHAFAVPAIFTGLFLLNVANAGLDQDTTQRLLASPDAKTGARGLYFSAFAALPLIAMFVTIGLLLHIFYQRPDLMGAANQAATSFEGEKVTVFIHYILTELPPGLRGLVTVGVTAAAVATTNSALNAMSSVMIEDFYKPWRERRGTASALHYVRAGRVGMAIVAVAMFAMAVLSFYWQRHTDMPLLEFALQVMVFAYAGLLGVYFVAVFTSRGNTASVIAALLGGFATVLLLQPFMFGVSGLAFPWQLCIGTLVAAAICAVPRGRQAA